MTALPNRPGRVSPSEYLDRERRAETRSEYLDGTVVAMAGASRRHARVSLNIAARLDEQLRDRDCHVYAADLRVSIDWGRHYVYPDVVVACGDERFESSDTLTNPVVVVEVLSPSTELYDRGPKFLAYQRIPSLREYVLISTDSRRIEVYRRERDGGEWTYASSPSPLELTSIGCRLTPAEVYFKSEVPEGESPP